jgi:hypothetical protein
MRTLILAGSFTEAAQYARGNELTYYRYASSASAVETFPAQRVVQLPGYARRRDVHAINAVVVRLKRRGIELVEDSYTPPAPEPGPSYGEAGYQADLLFGDLPQYDAGGTLPSGLTEVQDAPRVNEAKSVESLENKVSGRGQKSGPKATKPKVRTADVDDLFED